jgi:hypothetical protein
LTAEKFHSIISAARTTEELDEFICSWLGLDVLITLSHFSVSSASIARIPRAIGKNGTTCVKETCLHRQIGEGRIDLPVEPVSWIRRMGRYGMRRLRARFA